MNIVLLVILFILRRVRLGLNRTIAAVLFGCAFGFYTYYDNAQWNQLGRDAFIAHQMQRFDRYMAVPGSAVATVFEDVLFIVFVFAMYELIAAWVSKGLRVVGWKGEK